MISHPVGSTRARTRIRCENVEMKLDSENTNPYIRSTFDVSPIKSRSKLKLSTGENARPARPFHLKYWDQITQADVRERFFASYTTTYWNNVVELWKSVELFSFLADVIVPSESVWMLTFITLNSHRCRAITHVPAASWHPRLFLYFKYI